MQFKFILDKEEQKTARIKSLQDPLADIRRHLGTEGCQSYVKKAQKKVEAQNLQVEDKSKWGSKFGEFIEEEGEVQWGETSIGVIKVGGSDCLRAKAIIPRVVLGDPSCGALLKKVKQLGEKDGKAEGREEWAKGASLWKAF